SGAATTAEKYGIPATDGRYVRITVTANTQNDWVSISEVGVFGKDGTTPPPPSPNPSPNPDGVQMIYPTADPTKTTRLAVVGDVDNNNGFVAQLNLAKKYG